MEYSLLSCIKSSVQQFAQVISTVLEMDVDIVDENLIRIAGTDRFSRNINQSIDNQGNAFKRVPQTKKTLVVENPGKDEVCLTCVSKDICREKYEICCPVLLEGQVIGVISLAVFDKDKKAFIIERSKNYIEFLEQISSLIAAKAMEYKHYKQQTFSLELLKNLLGRITEGVIVFDQSQQILHINKQCENILGNNMQQLVYFKKIRQFAIHALKRKGVRGEVEYIARVKANKIRLIGNIHPIVVDGNEVATVFVFQDFAAYGKKVLQLHETQEYNFGNIIGKDPAFLKVKERAMALAYSDENMLIIGETGKGKGTLLPGVDADLVIFDTSAVWKVEGHRSKCDYSVYDGMNLKGKVISTICRGNFVIKDGTFAGGRGEYLHRGNI